MRTRTALAALTAAALWPAASPAQTPPKASVEIYGHAQLDYIADLNRVDPSWQATLRPSKIQTVDGQYGSDGQSIFSVRQSRIGARATLPAAGEIVRARVEFDFFGVGADAGQTTIRLRHAYGEWRWLLAGQTWTTFMDEDVIPNVVDYWAPNGRIATRREQIRVTPIRGDVTVAVALERSGQEVDLGEAREWDPSLAGNVQTDPKLPDLAARVRLARGFGHVQIAGLLRRLAFETKNAPGNEPSGETVGWGLAATSRIDLPWKGRLLLSLSGGEGIAAVMNDGGVDLAAEGAQGSADGAAVPLYGAMAYYEHTWRDGLTTALGYSAVQQDNTNLQLGSAFKRGHYASANLLVSPVKNLLVGAEALWGRRENKDGTSGDDFRVQLTARYGFSSLAAQ
ncbi:MAG TPA: DcaP family trimeric outer membrane transporter [Anaeromyxobacter sp.]|nr:DcaP family trimeric outer membrane transporter [Anaeromyxobacter sp.]